MEVKIVRIKPKNTNISTLNCIAEVVKKYNVLALNVELPFINAIFRTDCDKQIKDFVEELKFNGLGAKIQKGIVDSRYWEDQWKNATIPLPPEKIDKKARDILETYCGEFELTENKKSGMWEYKGDLGGREVYILCSPYCLSGGLKNSNAHFTTDIKKYGLEVLEGVKRDILKWRADHKGCLVN